MSRKRKVRQRRQGSQITRGIAFSAFAIFAVLIIVLTFVSSQSVTTGAVVGIPPFGADSGGPQVALWMLALVLLVPVELMLRKKS